MTGIRELIEWYAYCLWYYTKQTYNDLPGPHVVKILLVAICIAIPGPQDEILLLALTRACRAWRKRREQRQ
jgi:hypothetical protein